LNGATHFVHKIHGSRVFKSFRFGVRLCDGEAELVNKITFNRLVAIQHGAGFTFARLGQHNTATRFVIQKSGGGQALDHVCRRRGSDIQVLRQHTCRDALATAAQLANGFEIVLLGRRGHGVIALVCSFGRKRPVRRTQP
jgi:hypothetical protein